MSKRLLYASVLVASVACFAYYERGENRQLRPQASYTSFEAMCEADPSRFIADPKDRRC